MVSLTMRAGLLSEGMEAWAASPHAIPKLDAVANTLYKDWIISKESVLIESSAKCDSR